MHARFVLPALFWINFCVGTNFYVYNLLCLPGSSTWAELQHLYAGDADCWKVPSWTIGSPLSHWRFYTVPATSAPKYVLEHSNSTPERLVAVLHGDAGTQGLSSKIATARTLFSSAVLTRSDLIFWFYISYFPFFAPICCSYRLFNVIRQMLPINSGRFLSPHYGPVSLVPMDRCFGSSACRYMDHQCLRHTWWTKFPLMRFPLLKLVTLFFWLACICQALSQFCTVSQFLPSFGLWYWTSLIARFVGVLELKISPRAFGFCHSPTKNSFSLYKSKSNLFLFCQDHLIQVNSQSSYVSGLPFSDTYTVFFVDKHTYNVFAFCHSFYFSSALFCRFTLYRKFFLLRTPRNN